MDMQHNDELKQIERGSPEWHRRVDAVTEDIKKKIDEFGFTIIGVFPADGQSNAVPYVYTVGLTSLGLPELVLAMGADIRMLSTFLNYIVEKFRLSPEAVVIDCDGHDIMLMPMLNEHPDYPLSFVDRVYGSPMAMCQVLVSDDNGLYPTDEGFDPEVVHPVLF